MADFWSALLVISLGGHAMVFCLRDDISIINLICIIVGIILLLNRDSWMLGG